MPKDWEWNAWFIYHGKEFLGCKVELGMAQSVANTHANKVLDWDDTDPLMLLSTPYKVVRAHIAMIGGEPVPIWNIDGKRVDT